MAPLIKKAAAQNMRRAANKKMKNKFYMALGMIALIVILLAGFSSAITKSEIKEFLRDDLRKFFEGGNAELSENDLKILVTYYGNMTANEVNISKIPISEQGKAVLRAKYEPEEETETTAAANVTNLRATQRGSSFILWNWTKPADEDYAGAIIFIDGVNVATTTNDSYKATKLKEYTKYTITVHTKDNAGNINDKNVSNTANTFRSFGSECKSASECDGKCTKAFPALPITKKRICLPENCKLSYMFTWKCPK